MPTNKGPHAGFYSNFETPKINIRDEQGRFTSAQKELYAQNRTLAIRMKEKVAEVINSNIMRQQVKTGRLVRATLHPKNSIYGYDHVGVGDPDYLDKSIAKYWRTIEEGSAATWTKRSFLSLELQGIWGTNIQGGRWHTSAAGNEWASIGGGGIGSARQEMYQPLRKGRGGRPSGLPVFHPTREIRPMNAYRLVAENPQYVQMALRANDAFIQRILGRGITPRGFRGGIYDHG